MKFISAQAASQDSWDVIVIGSGMGSLFFLRRFLESRPDARVLILEKGGYNTHDWQIEHSLNSTIPTDSTYRNIGETQKPWDFTIGLGGSSNCWWGLTPRLHPTDFQIRTLTGEGVDWPISYDDLVPYYQQAERIMTVAGPEDLEEHYPGSSPYPQPHHHLTTADEMIRGKPGHHHFAMPTAKLSRPAPETGRNPCCSTSRCNLCPVDAKFHALNGMTGVLSHPNVSICLDSEVRMIDHAAGVAKAVEFHHEGADYKAACDLCVLGANAIHSPFIMLRSGIPGHGVGRYLGEKMLALVEVYLDGLDHFDGGTASTAFNITSLAEGRTAEHGSYVYIMENGFKHGFRLEPGKYRQTLPIAIYIEDHFDYENGVYDDGGNTPAIKFKPFSAYAHNTLTKAVERMPEILSALPVERIRETKIWPTMGHVQGSLRMGSNIENSVIDSDLVSHALRNLVVVGTSTFPTSGSVNPTLTAAALSLRSAERLVG